MFLCHKLPQEIPRPITSYGALDLPTYHLDLTPFIPVLTDGKPHNITLDVASAEPDHQINQNWFVSGLLQVKLDSSTVPTTGKITRYEASDFATSSVSGSASGLEVNFTLSASHNVHIEAEIIAGSGARTEVVFSQSLQYANVQNYLHNFTIQVRFCERQTAVTVLTHFGLVESLPGHLWSGLFDAQWRDCAAGYFLLSSHRQLYRHIAGRLILCVLAIESSPLINPFF